mmetsp:Transcript_25201/g.65425  ORF Transcript_25201/g.65425 Transcript_25201/m.65425 type:complete len:217 (+) Transcript_25201:368-1018(+)
MERHHDRLRGRIVDNLDEARFNIRESAVKELFDALEEIFRKFPNHTCRWLHDPTALCGKKEGARSNVEEGPDLGQQTGAQQRLWSDIHPEVLQLRADNHVITAPLPPHASHFLQLLDVVIMQVLMHFKDKATKAFRRMHKKRLIKDGEVIILQFRFLLVDSSNLISQRGSAWTRTSRQPRRCCACQRLRALAPPAAATAIPGLLLLPRRPEIHLTP